MRELNIGWTQCGPLDVDTLEKITNDDTPCYDVLSHAADGDIPFAKIQFNKDAEPSERFEITFEDDNERETMVGYNTPQEAQKAFYSLMVEEADERWYDCFDIKEQVRDELANLNAQKNDFEKVPEASIPSEVTEMFKGLDDASSTTNEIFKNRLDKIETAPEKTENLEESINSLQQKLDTLRSGTVSDAKEMYEIFKDRLENDDEIAWGTAKTPENWDWSAKIYLVKGDETTDAYFEIRYEETRDEGAHFERRFDNLDDAKAEIDAYIKGEGDYDIEKEFEKSRESTEEAVSHQDDEDNNSPNTDEPPEDKNITSQKDNASQEENEKDDFWKTERNAKKISELREKLGNSEAERDVLENRREKGNDRVKENREERIQDLNNEIESLKVKIDALEGKIESANEAYEALRDEYPNKNKIEMANTDAVEGWSSRLLLVKDTEGDGAHFEVERNGEAGYQHFKIGEFKTLSEAKESIKESEGEDKEISWSISGTDNTPLDDKDKILSEKLEMVGDREKLYSDLSGHYAELHKLDEEERAIGKEISEIQSRGGWEKDEKLVNKCESLVDKEKHFQELRTDLKAEIGKIHREIDLLSYKLGDIDIENRMDTAYKAYNVLKEEFPKNSDRMTVFEGHSHDIDIKVELVASEDTSKSPYFYAKYSDHFGHSWFESNANLKDVVSPAQKLGHDFSLNESDVKFSSEELEATKKTVGEEFEKNPRYSDAWLEETGKVIDGKAMIPPRIDGIYGLIRYSSLTNISREMEACGLKSDMIDFERMKWNTRGNNIEHTKGLRDDLIKYREAIENDNKEGIREFRNNYGEQEIAFRAKAEYSPDNKEDYLKLINKSINVLDKSINAKSAFRVLDVIDRHGLEGIIAEKLAQTIGEKFGAGWGAVVRNTYFGAHPSDWKNAFDRIYQDREADGKSLGQDLIKGAENFSEKLEEFEQRREQLLNNIKSFFVEGKDGELLPKSFKDAEIEVQKREFEAEGDKNLESKKEELKEEKEALKEEKEAFAKREKIDSSDVPSADELDERKKELDAEKKALGEQEKEPEENSGEEDNDNVDKRGNDKNEENEDDAGDKSKELEKIGDKINDKEIEIKDAESKLETKKAELAERKDKLEEKETKLEDAEKKLGAKIKEIDDKDNELNKVDKEIGDLKTAIAEKEEKIKELETSLEERKDGVERTTDSLEQSRIDALREEIKIDNERLEVLEDKKDFLEKAIDELKEDKSELEKNLESYREDGDIAKEAVELKEKDISLTEKEISDKKEELESLKEDKTDKLEAMVAEQEKKIAVLEGKIDNEGNSVFKEASSVEDDAVEGKNTEDSSDDLSGDEANDEKDDSRKAKGTNSSKQENSNDDFDNVIDDLKSLFDEYGVKDDNINDLISKLDELKNESGTSETELSGVKEEFQNVLSQNEISDGRFDDLWQKIEDCLVNSNTEGADLDGEYSKISFLVPTQEVPEYLESLGERFARGDITNLSVENVMGPEELVEKVDFDGIDVKDGAPNYETPQEPGDPIEVSENTEPDTVEAAETDDEQKINMSTYDNDHHEEPTDLDDKRFFEEPEVGNEIAGENVDTVVAEEMGEIVEASEGLELLAGL